VHRERSMLFVQCRTCISLFLSVEWNRVQRSPIGLLYEARMMMDKEECGIIGGMLGRGNRSAWRISVPEPVCLPYVLHDLTQARMMAAAVGRWKLTAWATAAPQHVHLLYVLKKIRKDTQYRCYCDEKFRILASWCQRPDGSSSTSHIGNGTSTSNPLVFNSYYRFTTADISHLS
jgi:hypothetical protein